MKILYLINQKISISESRVHQSSPALTFLIQTINENTREISKLADLCERTHYSQAYISELFSKKMGISPYQWILCEIFQATISHDLCHFFCMFADKEMIAAQRYKFHTATGKGLPALDFFF